jgi:hypothetical protein
MHSDSGTLPDRFPVAEDLVDRGSKDSGAKSVAYTGTLERDDFSVNRFGIPKSSGL